MLYAGVSLAGVSCRRRPLHTALALTTLLFQCELSGYVKLEAVMGGNFHTDLATLPQLEY